MHSPGSSATSESSSTSGTCQWSTRRPCSPRAPASSSAAMPRGDRRTSSGPSSMATRPPSRFINYCHGVPVTERLPQGMNLVSQKMGLSEWSYHNDYNPAPRQKMRHVDLTERFEKMNIEVELGFTVEQTAREVQRCLNCDIRDRIRSRALHRVRRLYRRLPGPMPYHHAQWRRAGSSAAAVCAGHQPCAGNLRFRRAAANCAHHD